MNWFENFEEKKWEEATFFSLKTGANCNRLGAGVFPGEREGYTFTWTFKEKAWHMHWSFDDLVVSRLAVTPIKQKVTTMPLEWGKTGKRGFWGWISAAEAAVMAKFQNLGERLEPGHVFSVVRFCGREISETSSGGRFYSAIHFVPSGVMKFLNCAERKAFHSQPFRRPSFARHGTMHLRWQLA